MKNNENNIFIDTNCLISYIGEKYGIYKDRNGNTQAIQYLMRQNGKSLYVSSLSIAQLTATLQKKIGIESTREEIEKLLHKTSILDFTRKDIEKAMAETNQQDMEDAYQYAISQKARCFYIMTNNIKDFSSRLNVTAFRPKEVRKIIYN